MKKVFLLLVAAGTLISAPAMAAKVDTKVDDFSVSRFYMGAGLNKTELTDDPFGYYDDAQGFELFVGYDLGLGFEQFKLMVEAGYYNSGDFEGKNILLVTPDFDVRSTWAAAVLNFTPVRNLDLMFRVGYGRGDSEAKGGFGGVGAGYWFAKNFGARVTYTERDDLDTVAAYAMFRF